MAHGSIQSKVVMNMASRIENIMENILGASHDVPEPMSRTEKLLQQIFDKIFNDKTSITITGKLTAIDKGDGTVELKVGVM
jgi:hypothetical protein